MQAGGRETPLFGEDHGDGLVVISLGETLEEFDGALVGCAEVPTGLVQGENERCGGAAFPGDPQVGLAIVLAHGDGHLGDDRPQQLLSFTPCRAWRIEDGAHVRTGTFEPRSSASVSLVGRRSRCVATSPSAWRCAERFLEAAFQRPGDEAVLGLDCVELTPGPFRREAGTFGGEFEHRHFLAVIGVGLGKSLGRGGQAAGSSTAKTSSRTRASSLRPPML